MSTDLGNALRLTLLLPMAELKRDKEPDSGGGKNRIIAEAVLQ